MLLLYLRLTHDFDGVRNFESLTKDGNLTDIVTSVLEQIDHSKINSFLISMVQNWLRIPSSCIDMDSLFHPCGRMCLSSMRCEEGWRWKRGSRETSMSPADNTSVPLRHTMTWSPAKNNLVETWLFHCAFILPLKYGIYP